VKDYSKTNTSGGINRFQTTHWSVIYAARTKDEHRQKEIISDITLKYWRPVYCYLRRKGYHDTTAKDLTQGFFCDIILGHELIQHADKNKGRFRSLLLTALERYVVSIRRSKSRKKRQPNAGIHQLETDELSNLAEAYREMKPEDTFYYTWASDLLDCVLEEVRDEYCCTGRTTHWEIFRLKVLDPIMGNVEAPSYTEICSKCGFKDESKASNMAITVKRRFRAILKRHLRDLVQSDSEVEEELEEIFTILSRSSSV
jgi:DNA-directed RNA polymerase specialized sigma24 family protein